MRIALKRVRADEPEIPLPRYATAGAAGLDLVAACDTSFARGIADVPTGIALAIPLGWVGLIRSRSGLAFRHHIRAFHGTIDADYRGEILVRLCGPKDHPLPLIERGMRIAQLILVRHEIVTLEEVDELPSTDRGNLGFGSTGL